MGDGAVGRHGACADDPHLRAQAVVEQGVQPLRLHRRRVRVEEQAERPAHVRGGEIAGGGRGERTGRRDHPHAPGSEAGDLVHPVAHLGGAGVVDQQQFVVRPGGVLEDREHAALQYRQAVRSKDDERHPGLGRVPVVDPVQAGPGLMDLRLFVAAGVQVAGDRAPLRGVGAARRRADQQRFGQVADPVQSVALEQAQDQVQFVGAGMRAVEAARGQHRVPAEHPVPAHGAGAAQQQVQVEVRAQRRRRVARGIAVPLVGEQRAQAAAGGQRDRQAGQAAGGEFGAGLDHQQPFHVPAGDGGIERAGRVAFVPGQRLHVDGPGGVDRRTRHPGLHPQAGPGVRGQAVHGGLRAAGCTRIRHDQHAQAGRDSGRQVRVQQLRLHAGRPAYPQPLGTLPVRHPRRVGLLERIDQVDPLHRRRPVEGTSRHLPRPALAAVPAQRADARAQGLVAGIADAGAVAPDLAELFGRYAEVHQRRAQHRRRSGTQQLDVEGQVGDPGDAHAVQHRQAVAHRQQRLAPAHDRARFAEEVERAVGEEAGDVVAVDQQVRRREGGGHGIGQRLAGLVHQPPAHRRQRRLRGARERLHQRGDAAVVQHVVVVQELDVFARAHRDGARGAARLPQARGIARVAHREPGPGGFPACARLPRTARC